MKQRVISAIVLCIICIPLLVIGGLAFKVGVSVIAVFGLYELFSVSSERIKIHNYVEILSYILLIGFVFFDINVLAKILLVFITLGTTMIFIDNKNYNIESVFYTFGSITLLGIVFNNLTIIREEDINIVIYLVLVTILTDTFAYLSGKTLGRHKLIPSVSPNKTIEGSVVGGVFGTLFPYVFYIFMIEPGLAVTPLILSFVLSILDQIGDLFFSKIKRFYKVKDFSDLIPGHGGVLDRIDGLIFIILGYIIFINLI